MTRDDVTQKIIATKVSKGIKWADATKKIGLSKEFCTTVLLGQGVLTPTEAKKAAKVFGLTAEETKWLSVVPYRGGLPTAVPTGRTEAVPPKVVVPSPPPPPVARFAMDCVLVLRRTPPCETTRSSSPASG